ncbi:MAG: GTPase Obg [Candidatus Hydrogenedentota bacterium]
MFVDRARIKVTGGHGGDGCCSFRREKFIPFGGPNGGDGGRGGDVVFRAESQLQSLLDVRFHAHWKGNAGMNGEGSDRHGKRGEPSYISVPVGTIIKRFETEEVLADLNEHGATFLAANGGKGGRGNPRFATRTNKAPHFAEKGEPGEESEFLLELKVMAEVGLVGLPNAGKSTFLAAVTSAQPKIADYPFTTLSPNLGVAPLSDHRTLMIADIPGIIEGASEGKGLGHDFLRHIERTRVLLFIIDLGDPDPEATRDTLLHELESYSPALLERPRFYALNKSDVTENRERFELLKDRFDRPYLISGYTGEGVEELVETLWETVDRLRNQVEEPEVEEGREYVFEAPFTIQKAPDGFVIEGKRIIQMVRMTDFGNEEAIRYFQIQLKKLGIMKALKRLGAVEGQTIHIGPVELVYIPD